MARERWPDLQPMLSRPFGGQLNILVLAHLTFANFRHFLLHDVAKLLLDSPVSLVGARVACSAGVGGIWCGCRRGLLVITEAICR